MLPFSGLGSLILMPVLMTLLWLRTGSYAAAAAVPELPDWSIWDKYGLPGLIIGVMMLGFFLLGRSIVKRATEAEERQQAFVDRILTQHRLERDDWRDDSARHSREHRESLERLVIQTNKVVEDNNRCLMDLHSALGSGGPRVRG